MRKHFTLMLVFLLLLGMTASATNTVYYVQDFNYADNTQLQADAYIDNTISYSNNSATTTYNIAKWIAGGKKIIGNHTGIYHASHVKLENNTFKRISAGDQEYNITFFPNDSWDGTAHPTETYVISFNLVPSTRTLSAAYYFGNLIGLRGNATTPAYNAARILSISNGVSVIAPTDSQTTGNSLDYSTTETKRVAFGFTYDSTTGGLKRDDAVDGVSKGRGATFELTNMTTVEGIGFSTKTSRPYIGKIRMYTIDNTEGFKVTAVDSGDVSPLGPKITVKFNRPIISINKNQISITNGSEDVTKFTVSEPETFINGREIYSTVDIEIESTLKDDEDYSIIFNDTVTDEIGNIIASPNNKVDFHTQDYPRFVTNTSVKDLGNGVNISELVDKNVTFNSSFRNASSSSVDAVIFVGIYSVGADEEKDTADDKLVGYSLAKTSIASESEQSISFGTKVEAGTYAKALSFSSLDDLANPDINFSEGNPVID